MKEDLVVRDLGLVLKAIEKRMANVCRQRRSGACRRRNMQIGSDPQHPREVCLKCVQTRVCSGGSNFRTFSDASQKKGCAGGGLCGKRILACDENATVSHLQKQPKPVDGLQNSAVGYMERTASQAVADDGNQRRLSG